ncbi:induced myeloid leukemia cell differentiation protein Mcl-1 [Ambystoma mexicanum]|uniref:induced myeloid leukemia cell differentiation protein Mcl-1 n=1 Tax=Ambystoma mexicanum TaxID=8296 RepID=UPI0037E77437
MLTRSCLLNGPKRSAVLQLNVCCAGGRLPLGETDSGCSDGYNSDSSPSPCSPSLETTRFVTPETTPIPQGPLYTRTRTLIRDYFNEYANGTRAKAATDPALSTLRRVGGSVMDKHQLAFDGMLRKLNITGPADLKPVMSVSSHVFDDGVTNWGRIVTLISFGAFVSKHLKARHLESSIDTLAESFTEFLMTSKRDWIVDHNEWDGFVEFFHVDDVEGGIRNVLMTLAGVAGVGAGLAFMIR